MPCDYSNYPKDWKQIRERILKREFNCCKVCGVLNYSKGARDKFGHWHSEEQIDGMKSDDGFHHFNGEYPKIIRIVLTVAHLNHDVGDNSDENLAALCQLHHLRHDIDHHKKNSRATRNRNKGLQNLF